MRLCSYLLFLVSLFFNSLSTLLAHADQTFPYKAYAVSDNVYVRSGPGQNYYPTGKLKVGQEVEVHRHDPGGWYAVKPPEGNFTWVSSRYLEKKGKGLAQVTGDRVAARVGSQFSDVRDVIQVRLERGETVEILGEKEFMAGSESGMWYKIAPPSGEFRWVFGKYVDPEFPRDGVRKSSAEESPLLHPARPPAASSSVDLAPPPKPEPRERQARVSLAGHHGGHLRPGSITRSGPVVPPQEAAEPPPPSPPPAAAAPPPVVVAPPAEPALMRRISPEEYADQLEALDIQLSRMLAEEPSVWEFGEIDAKAHSLLAQGETALERGRARLLLNKIAQASDIKRRSDEIHSTQAELERNGRRMADLARRRVGMTGTADSHSRFDGTGRLARVVPSKLGAPQYALVDEKGAVRCYVTPAPGLNLRYYEGRQVGISGIRGYISEQNAQHLTAKHIAPLEEVRWR